MRYKSKPALLEDIRTQHDLLRARLAEVPDVRWREPGVWGDGWTLSDLVAHLSEWQHLFLRWYGYGQRGAQPELPAPGFKWNETPRLNRAIWEQHRSRSPEAILADFDSGYRRIVTLVETLSPEQLLEPGHYEWTRRNSLATYIGPNTASHYRFALKVIARCRKRPARAEVQAPKTDMVD